ncbi:hypothetical protein N9432_04505 [Acidimicrobiia bacterium]|nr:hypothetical protein [Acidimicrobiia bacterium]
MNNEENKIDQNLNEESLVSDLKKSLDSAIREASITLNELLENIESTIQDNEIRDETKKIIKNFSEDLKKSLEVASYSSFNKENKKNFSKEEE